MSKKRGKKNASEMGISELAERVEKYDLINNLAQVGMSIGLFSAAH